MNTGRNDDQPADDARFDAAWRSVSNEEPPPALDAALRAAARREVGAGPLRAQSAVPEATRPERWWFPLAAAATIGAIALGLLQIVGTEGLFDGGTSTVVSDIPPGTTPVKREAVADAPSTPSPAAEAPIARGLVIPPAATGYATAQKPAADAAPAAPRPEAKLVRRQAVDAAADPARADTAAPSAPGNTAAARVEPAPVAAPPPPPPPEGVEQAREAASASASASTPAGRAATAEAPPATSDAAARTAPPAVVAPRPSRPASAAPPAAARLVVTPSERRRDDAMRDTQDARTPLPVADWIALIRRLRDEGKLDEAARELAAFRRAHPDHLQLLPPDLARWRPDAR